MENKKSWRSLLLYLGIPIVIIIIIVLVIGNMPQKTMKYSEILNYFETQQVTEFDLDLGSGAMVLTLNDGDESKKKEPTQIQYSVPNVTILYEDIKPYIEEYNKDKSPPRHLSGCLSQVPDPHVEFSCRSRFRKRDRNLSGLPGKKVEKVVRETGPLHGNLDEYVPGQLGSR